MWEIIGFIILLYVFALITLGVLGTAIGLAIGAVASGLTILFKMLLRLCKVIPSR